MNGLTVFFLAMVALAVGALGFAVWEFVGIPYNACQDFKNVNTPNIYATHYRVSTNTCAVYEYTQPDGVPIVLHWNGEAWA